MVVCTFPEGGPDRLDRKTKHLIRQVTDKIAFEMKIPQEFFYSEEEIQNPEQATKLNDELKEEESSGYPREEILKEALKQIRNEQGAFPNEKLEKIYADLMVEDMAREIAQKIDQGEDKYQLLGEYGKKLKAEGIEAGEELGKKVDELLGE